VVRNWRSLAIGACGAYRPNVPHCGTLVGRCLGEGPGRADIITAIGELDVAQANGDPPATLVAGSAPGESGLAVFCHPFWGGMHFRATPRHHCICFQISPKLRMAGKVVRHEPPAGSLIIHPAGFDCAADADDSVDTLTVVIDPRGSRSPLPRARSARRS